MPPLPDRRHRAVHSARRRGLVLALGLPLALVGCAWMPPSWQAGATAGAGSGPDAAWSPRMEAQFQQMRRAAAGTGIEVSRTRQGEIHVQIPSDAGFDVGRAALRPSLRGVLDRFALAMREHPGTQIRILGHTDSTGSDAINGPLSTERAAATRDHLVGRGVPFGRIRIDGRGSREPLASNDSAQGRARNRRVEILVSEGDAVAGR